MQKLIGSVILLGVLSSCNFGTQNTQGINSSESELAITKVVFDKEIHDFGRVAGGEEIACRFGFVNTGNEPLVIQDVVAGCGCTHVDYPKEPIQPGQKGAVEVVFNTSGRHGHQRQVVRVISNETNQSRELIIRAQVE